MVVDLYAFLNLSVDSLCPLSDLVTNDCLIPRSVQVFPCASSLAVKFRVDAFNLVCAALTCLVEFVNLSTFLEVSSYLAPKSATIFSILLRSLPKSAPFAIFIPLNYF